MSFEDSVKNILFEIGKEIKVHSLQDGHLILEIDYDKYANQLIDLFNNYKEK